MIEPKWSRKKSKISATHSIIQRIKPYQVKLTIVILRHPASLLSATKHLIIDSIIMPGTYKTNPMVDTETVTTNINGAIKTNSDLDKSAVFLARFDMDR